MPSAKDTAYPTLKLNPSPKELTTLYTPNFEDLVLAQKVTQTPHTQLGFLILYKCFQRLGYAVNVADVPVSIAKHIAATCQLPFSRQGLTEYDASKSRKRHLIRIREHLQIRRFTFKGRQVVAQSMTEATKTKHDLSDLINIAIEELIRHRCELPAFSFLLRSAQRIRKEGTALLYRRIARSMTFTERQQIKQLFEPTDDRTTTLWHEVKREPGKPMLSRLSEWVDRLIWLSELQIASDVLSTLPAVKVEHFSAEAQTLDAGRMKQMERQKRYVLAISLLATQYARTLDDIGELFIKRVRQLHHKGEEALADYRRANQNKTDELVTTLRDLVIAYQSDGHLKQRFRAMEEVIGDEPETLLADCDAHLAYLGNNYFSFLPKLYRSHRSVFFKLLDHLPLYSSTQDKSLEQAISFIRRQKHKRTTWLSIPAEENQKAENPSLDLSWVPQKWWSLVTGNPRKQGTPTQVHRIYLELCVFSELAWGLLSGDLYISSSNEYGDYNSQLIGWEEYEATLDVYGEMVKLPVEPKAFVAHVQQQLQETATQVDQAFPTNEHVSYNKERLRVRKPKRLIPEQLPQLESLMAQHIRPAHILDVLSDTQQWLDWTRYFKPISGHSAKLTDAVHRYLLTTFCFGCNLGPSQTARSVQGIDRRQLAWINHRHIQEDTLNQAIESVIDAYNRFALPKYWGSGKGAAVDGTKWEIHEQNLLAEYHIRYGGYGGIGYYHVSDTYIALFSHFIPCGVWEAVFMLDGLIKNQSAIQPDTIYGDTQSQSTTVFALAYLLGITLMPRIRGWQDLTFYRPTRKVKYQYLDGLFSEVADWDLIERHLPDMWRVVLSIKAGKIQASTILRKLGSYSRDNKLFQAFQALGGVLRTRFLLQYLNDPLMRSEIQGATNKCESFNRLVKWLAFGGEHQVIGVNHRDELRKRIKYNHLVANCVILHNVAEISRVLHDLGEQNITFEAAAIASLSPYPTEHLNRFGMFGLDLDRQAEPLNFDLKIPVMESPSAEVVNENAMLT